MNFYKMGEFSPTKRTVPSGPALNKFNVCKNNLNTNNFNKDEVFQVKKHGYFLINMPMK